MSSTLTVRVASNGFGTVFGTVIAPSRATLTRPKMFRLTLRTYTTRLKRQLFPPGPV